MQGLLHGQIAVVSGGGRGIGAAICSSLAEAGAAVAVLDVEGETARATADRLTEAGSTSRGYPADVGSEESVMSALASVRRDLGEPSIVVNNAGISRPGATVETDVAVWNEVIRVNLTGCFLLIKHSLPHMLEAGHGRIINIASFAAKSSPLYADNASYAATKAGVVGLTHNVAIEAASRGVTVNAIAPGIVDTELLRGAHSPERRAELLAKLPVRRFTTVEEVGALVAFLASPAAGSITGETVNINGGLYLD